MSLLEPKLPSLLARLTKRLIIFVRGATEGINLIAHGFVETQLCAGDEILITHMEHHANIVPWQIVAEKTGAIVKVVPVLDSGDLDMEAMPRSFRIRPNLLASSTSLIPSAQ